jgi:hypothetical protein
MKINALVVAVALSVAALAAVHHFTRKHAPPERPVAVQKGDVGFDVIP